MNNRFIFLLEFVSPQFRMPDVVVEAKIKNNTRIKKK